VNFLRRGLRPILQRAVSVLTDVGETAGSNVAIILASFGASVLAARLLGPEHRGTLAAAVVYVALATAIADAGLNQAVPFFAARHKPQAAAVLGTTCLLGLVLGSAVSTAAYLLLRLRGADSPVVLFFLPSVPFSLLTTHLSTFLYGSNVLTPFNTLRVLQSSVVLVAIVAGATTGNADVSRILVIAVAVSAALAAGAVWAVSRHVPLRQWTVRLPVAKNLLAYALQSYVGNLCWLLNSRLDQLMMSFLVPSAVLGIYATSVSYSGVVFSCFSAFAMLAFAKASALEKHGDVEVTRTIRHYLVVSLAMGIPVAVALALVAPWLYPVLFGVEFEPGVPVAMILCLASVFLGLNYTLSNGLRIRNRPLLPSVAEAAGVVVSIIGLFIVLPRAGMFGAALVSLASYAVVFAILLYLTRFPGSSARLTGSGS